VNLDSRPDRLSTLADRLRLRGRFMGRTDPRKEVRVNRGHEPAREGRNGFHVVRRWVHRWENGGPGGTGPYRPGCRFMESCVSVGYEMLCAHEPFEDEGRAGRGRGQITRSANCQLLTANRRFMGRTHPRPRMNGGLEPRTARGPRSPSQTGSHSKWCPEWDGGFIENHHLLCRPHASRTSIPDAQPRDFTPRFAAWLH